MVDMVSLDFTGLLYLPPVWKVFGQQSFRRHFCLAVVVYASSLLLTPDQKLSYSKSKIFTLALLSLGSIVVCRCGF